MNLWRSVVFIGSFFLHSCIVSAYDFDVAVIGGGAAGMVAAFVAAEDYKKNVVFIEEKLFGGSYAHCADVSFGILSRLAHDVHNARSSRFCLGKNIQKFLINKDVVLPYIRDKKNIFSQGCSRDFFTNCGITCISEYASFLTNHTLRVGSRKISAKNIIIATGSATKTNTIKGLDSVSYLTSETLLLQDKLPDSLMIVGGGQLGVQVASALNHLGVSVTLVMKHTRLLLQFDQEVVRLVRDRLEKEGVTIYCSMSAEIVCAKKGKIFVTCIDSNDGIHDFEVESLFVATGRAANLAKLCLENVGLELDNSCIAVNKKMQTSVANIYACGDVVNKMYRSSNLSFYQGRVAGVNASKSFWQKSEICRHQAVPQVVYLDIPLASLGLTEEEARNKYGELNIRVYKQDYSSLVKAHVDASTDGVAKFICTSEGVLVGAHIFGQRANEIIDTVKIGEIFSEQFDKYALKAYTSPSYLEVLQLATECAKQDFIYKN